jgi:hypothetical protein
MERMSADAESGDWLSVILLLLCRSAFISENLRRICLAFPPLTVVFHLSATPLQFLG